MIEKDVQKEKEKEKEKAKDKDRAHQVQKEEGKAKAKEKEKVLDAAYLRQARAAQHRREEDFNQKEKENLRHLHLVVRAHRQVLLRVDLRSSTGQDSKDFEE